MSDYNYMLNDNLEADKLGEVDEPLINRRRHPRSVFTYPVEFKLFSPQKAEGVSYNGYLKDISLGGAALQFEDRYGRFNLADADDAKLKMVLSIPRENKVSFFAHIQWVKKIEGSFSIKIGISFKDLEYDEQSVIEKLIGLKGKDHNMMWNLWEQYDQ